MSERLARYAKAREDRLAGKYNGAPIFFHYPKLGKVLPVIPKGKQAMVLGGTGSGKTNFWIGFFLMTIYSLIKEHNYKARFYIFLLEDPKELLEDRLFCRILYTRYGISIDPLELNSMKESILDDEIRAKFQEVDAIVEDILSYCTLIDSIYNPTGVYKYLRTESEKLGTHYWEDKQFTYKNDDDTTYSKDVRVYKEYVPNDPDEHVFVVLDNLNNLSGEGKDGGSVRDSINRWARDYGRLQITKHWNWTTISVIQTALEFDKKEFNMRGESIIEKLEPNIAALGDSKTCSRDMHIILALFAPHRFGITSYEGYNIAQLKDNFRALLVIKSNISQADVKVPLLFLGSSSYYEELPSSKDMTPELYKKYSINLNLLTKK